MEQKLTELLAGHYDNTEQFRAAVEAAGIGITELTDERAVLEFDEAVTTVVLKIEPGLAFTVCEVYPWA